MADYFSQVKIALARPLTVFPAYTIPIAALWGIRNRKNANF
jgi:hypothetical protein